MKTANDPRHLRRIAAFKELFSWNYQKTIQLKSELAQKVADNISSIDSKISISAPSWPLDKINKIDLAILRLAVFELIIIKEVSGDTQTLKDSLTYKVVVDEAVELAKEFGSDSSPSFVNGVLATLIKSLGLVTKD